MNPILLAHEGNMKKQIEMYRESIKEVPFKTFGMEEWLALSISASEKNILKGVLEWAEEKLTDKDISNGYFNAMTDLATLIRTSLEQIK